MCDIGKFSMLSVFQDEMCFEFTACDSGDIFKRKYEDTFCTPVLSQEG